jgi:hypothetical protein
MAGSFHPSAQATRILYATGAVALANFAVFVLVSTWISGDALNGYVSDGRFFVCAHGRCAQVSPSVWHYSYWHALVTIGLMLLVVAETLYFYLTGQMKRAPGN